MGASSSIPKEHKEHASDDEMVLIRRETSGSKDKLETHSSKEEVPTGTTPTVANMDPKRSENDDKVQAGPVSEQPSDDTAPKQEEAAVKKEKKLLTEEEISERKAEYFGEMKERIEKVEALEERYDEDGKCDLDVRKALYFMGNLYFKMKDVKLEDLIIFRRECAKLFLETKMFAIACDLILHTHKIGWITDEGEVIKNMYSPLTFAMLAILNFSDASPEYAIEVANYPGILETMKQNLIVYLEDHLKEIPEKDKILNWTISITHNVSMQETNSGRLRELDFTSVLKPYLESHNERYKINVLATLAAIVDEKESEIINKHPDSVQFLLTVLQKSLKNKERRHLGWSSKESGLTVRLLARNDANKKLLVELGALELLVKLGQTGLEEEQFEAVSAITHLAFEKENRKKIVDTPNLGVVDMLATMISSPDREVKKMCVNALWTLREELKQSSNETYQNIGERYGGMGATNGRAKSAVSKQKPGGVQEVDDQDLGHIMISYQWADQQIMMKIRDQLKSAKHRVWMDIDQMGGSTLQAMADAVENASIILMCMSQKYKDSPNCRAEAEYAFQKHKKIIPLKMQRGYVPDGWLGFICGAKLFFDFGGKYPFEDKMFGLIKEVSAVIMKLKGLQVTEEFTKETVKPLTRASPVPMDTVDSKPVARTTAVIPMATVNKVRKWQKNDVDNWMAKNDLQSCGLGKLTGGEIALLMSMRLESPDTFYKCLQDMVKICDLLTLSKVVWALHDLTE